MGSCRMAGAGGPMGPGVSMGPLGPSTETQPLPSNVMSKQAGSMEVGFKYTHIFHLCYLPLI